jgi:hypothetical protein
MTVTAFCKALGSRWRLLARALWPETPERQARADQARLAAELARRRERMLRRRRTIERLRGDLPAQEKRAARLLARVEARVGQADEASAWELALELDRARGAAERCRERLRRHESAYERQRLRFRSLKDRGAAAG